jgi:hypothetical protein
MESRSLLGKAPWAMTIGKKALKLLLGEPSGKTFGNSYLGFNGKFTEYVGGTIYVNNQPIMAGTPEGRLLPDGNGQWQPEYHLKDHLGKTRALVAVTLLPVTSDLD